MSEEAVQIAPLFAHMSRLSDDNQVVPITLEEYAQHPGAISTQIAIHATDRDEQDVSKQVVVSTVFCCVPMIPPRDGNPALHFEMMVFGGEVDGMRQHTATYEAAIRVHEDTVHDVVMKIGKPLYGEICR